jgi:hypothetical protein
MIENNNWCCIDDRCSYGRLLMKNVLNFGESSTDDVSLVLIGSANTSQPHYASFLNTGESHRYNFTIGASPSFVRVVMAYTDYPRCFGRCGCRSCSKLSPGMMY